MDTDHGEQHATVDVQGEHGRKDRVRICQLDEHVSRIIRQPVQDLILHLRALDSDEAAPGLALEQHLQVAAVAVEHDHPRGGVG